MQHSLLVRVLHAVTDLAEEPQSFAQGQRLLIAERCDRLALHQLHREVRLSPFRRAGVVELRDRLVVHAGERLLLARESLEDGIAVHAALQHLQRNATAHRLRLLGEIHLAESAAPQSRNGAVGADALGQIEPPVGRGVEHRGGFLQRGTVLRVGRGEFGQSPSTIFCGMRTEQRFAERVGKVVRQAW